MAKLTGLQRLMEAGIIVAGVFALFLLLALVSYHPGDPGWSQVGLRLDIQNWVGATGAWFADVLLFFFGYLAFTFPFLSAYVGWFLFKQIKNVRDWDYLTIGLRLVGGLTLALGATGIASMNVDNFFSFPAGGAVGDVISAALVPYFNVAGTLLLLLCFVLTGFTLLTGVSWLTIIDGIGASVIWVVQKGWQLPVRVRAQGLLRHNERAAVPEHKVNGRIDVTALRAEPVFSEPPTPVEHPTPVERPTPIERPTPVRRSTPVETPRNVPVMDVDEIEEDEVISPVTIPSIPEQLPEGPLPSFDLLDRPDRQAQPISEEELEIVSRLLEDKLADFNIEASVVGVYPGPVITRFELDLAPGVKVSRITTLSKDLARAMSAISVRVVEVIPGKSVIGLELPNKHREMVRLSEVITCDSFQNNESPLTMVLGADISGKPVVVDLAKMPHLLVAGTTGSGKSVGVNVMILSLLYKSTPEDVRMIMIDPKMLELSVYEGIPHLLAEVVTDMKEAANALRWCVGEMERRYKLMSALGVRNLKGYNAKVRQALADGTPIKDPLWRAEESMDSEAPDLQKMPHIVVVVDEFADMIMIVGKKVEELIARIAQKARAAGIHLILATQRPSVDVITGLIKANIPTRIAFQVSSKIDSRTILDQQGAEALLGMGDMLYLPPGSPVPTRVHGAFVDDHEVHAVVADWKQRGEPDYIDEILNGDASSDILLPGEVAEGDDQELDAFYDEAVAFVTESRRASVSSVQRRFRIGYNRAARLVEQMEASGVVTAPGHNGNREVLAPPPPRG